MVRATGAMHVARIVRKHVGKDGQPREYVSYLLRRSVRDGRRIRHENLANLSALPEPAIEAVRAALAGKTLVVAGEQLEVLRSRPHGHVAAIVAAARGLGLPDLLGPPGRARDLAFALIVARIARPASKLDTFRWLVDTDTTLGEDLGIADASLDEIYETLDYLAAHQDDIQAGLAARYLCEGGLAMFDLSSSWMTGVCCPLSSYGYSRDGKHGYPQIEYGLLTDPHGRPVAVEVFAGNTADPTAFVAIVERCRTRFGLARLVMVGDRGMITSARIAALRAAGAGYGWLTALRAPDIAALAADAGPLQLSLFDQTNLAEITHPDYPGERLVACRNPALADERARKRAALLDATETDLAKVATAVGTGRLKDPGAIGLRVGKVISKHKMEKHFTLSIAEGVFSYARNQVTIHAEAALDGIYVLRTSVDADTLDAPSVVGAYKNLARLERGFRSIKTIDLAIRPVRHYTETRVRAHVFLCMLAEHIVFELRQALAPLTYTDDTPPPRTDPVTQARRSRSADTKAATHTSTDGQPVHSFPGLLDHLATLTRNHIRVGGDDQTSFELLAIPTPTQRRAFELLQAPIPLRLGSQ